MVIISIKDSKFNVLICCTIIFVKIKRVPPLKYEIISKLKF